MRDRQEKSGAPRIRADAPEFDPIEYLQRKGTDIANFPAKEQSEAAAPREVFGPQCAQ